MQINKSKDREQNDSERPRANQMARAQKRTPFETDQTIMVNMCVCV